MTSPAALACVSTLLALCSCSTAKLVSSATPPEEPYMITLKADQPAGFLVVAGTLDGRAARFVFDTGAGATVLHTAAVARSGLRRRTMRTRDAGGNIGNLPVARIDALGIGGAAFRDVGAVVSDLSFIEHHLCEPIDGILGANLLQSGALQVDYETGTIRIASGAEQLPRPKGRAKLAKLLPMPLPVIPVEAENVRFGLIIDTGSNGDIAIDGGLLEALGVTDRVPAIGTTSAGLLGLGGRDEAFVWPAVRVGQLDLTGADASTAPVATLGNLILRSFILRIDYDRHVASFWPNARPIPTGHVTFGFSWDYDDRGGARVVFVRERSAALAAGIEEGDPVEQIGDTKIADLDRDALCRLRRDWTAGEDTIEIVVAGETHCLRRHSLFEEPPPTTECSVEAEAEADG